MVSDLADCHEMTGWVIVRVFWDLISPLFQAFNHVLPPLGIICDSRLGVRGIYPFNAVQYHFDFGGKFCQLEKVNCA
jgi:hypothetical protein